MCQLWAGAGMANDGLVNMSNKHTDIGIGWVFFLIDMTKNMEVQLFEGGMIVIHHQQTPRFFQAVVEEEEEEDMEFDLFG